MSLTEPLISEILWTALKQFLPAAVTQKKTMPGALSPLEAIAFSVSEIDVEPQGLNQRRLEPYID